MTYRDLGDTGEQVSAIGIGGWHLGLKKATEKTAISIVHQAIERGINFFDNSWDYNEGTSEKSVGESRLARRRTETRAKSDEAVT